VALVDAVVVAAGIVVVAAGNVVVAGVRRRSEERAPCFLDREQ